MREIKFRVWNPIRNKYGTEFTLMMDINCKLSANSSNWRLHQKECSQLTLEQFTGLLDKNGKEIYEGDIVVTYYGKFTIEFGSYDNFEDSCNGVGFYLRNTKLPRTASTDYNLNPRDTFEVIGNIYENPELLEG